MELREQLRSSPTGFQRILTPEIPNFLLFGCPIEPVNGKAFVVDSLAACAAQKDTEHPRRKATLSGSLDRTDWDNFMHLLVATKVSPDKAVLNMELMLSPESPDNRRMKMLAELAKKLGLNFKVV